MEGQRKILKAVRKKSPEKKNVQSETKGKVNRRKRKKQQSSPSKAESRPKVVKKPMKCEKTQPGVSLKPVDRQNLLSSLKNSPVKSAPPPHDFGLKLQKGSFKIPKKSKSAVKESKPSIAGSRLEESKEKKNFEDPVVVSKVNVNVMGGDGGDPSLFQFLPGTLPSTSERNDVPILDECEGMEWETTVQEIKNLWPKIIDGLSNPFTLDSGGMDDMEVDFMSSPFEFSNQLILVADTNIWIHCLSFLKELLDTNFKIYSYPQLIIPWMVLQELDVSGKFRVGPSRQAIHYIYKLLSSNHPRVTGQRASEACFSDPNFDRLVADDSILQCAQQQQQQKPGATVVLLTNDRNMLNKALVNSIIAVDGLCGVKSVLNVLASKNPEFSFNIESNISQPKVTSLIKQDNVPKWNSPSTITPATPNFEKVSKREHSPEKETDDGKKYKIQPQAQLSNDSSLNTFSNVLELFRQTLSYIVETKMKEDYGEDGWMNALKIPPPWTVKSVLQCLIKHWIAVFTEIFGRRVAVAEQLLDLIKRRESGVFQDSKKAEEEIIEGALGLFAAGEFAMSPIVKTDSRVRSCVQALLAYKKAKQE